MILGFTGETIKISVTIREVDSTLVDLSTAIVVFALKKPNGIIVFKTPTIVGSDIEVTLYEDMDVAGEYAYELKVSINNEVNTVARDTIILHQSLIPAVDLEDVVVI